MARICPILSLVGVLKPVTGAVVPAGMPRGAVPLAPAPIECQGENCQWWYANDCALVVTAAALAQLACVTPRRDLDDVAH